MYLQAFPKLIVGCNLRYFFDMASEKKHEHIQHFQYNIIKKNYSRKNQFIKLAQQCIHVWKKGEDLLI